MNRLIVLVAVCVAGCASIGQPIDMEAANSIQKGVTTKAQLIEKLGPPNTASLMGDGRQSLMWIYTHSQVNGKTFIPIAGLFLGGADTDQTTFQVILDRNNVVQDDMLNQTSMHSGH